MERNSVFSAFTIRFIFVGLFLIPSVYSQRPIAAKWSTSTIGPDGPWQAVEVTLGNGSPVALYPGNIYSSWVITTGYCNLNRSSDGCFASVAGTYNKEQGEQLGTGSSGQINFNPDIQGFSPGSNVQGPDAFQWVDRVDAGLPVSNVSLALLEDQMLAYPNGEWYPAFAGCLGLGASGQTKQSFAIDDFTSVNATLIPGTLWENDDIPSNSFGLHIGSVSSETSGSLWWGGYDRSRITGDILQTDLSDKDSEANFDALLTDIAIEVVDGVSPFDFEGKEQSGLLSSRSGGGDEALPVLINGCSPYLSLPKSTCDKIADHLPVKYNPGLGLYTWNTEAPRYRQITTSASVLAFTIQSESDSSSEITIRVPFTHLNLNLSKPLVPETTAYFPCFTGAPDETYVLGRAFMQDAFIGANWGIQTWWLAQAPGPNFARLSSATPISEDEDTIESGGEDWKATWDGAWRVLTEEDMKDVENPEDDPENTPDPKSDGESASPSPSAEDDEDEGLSTGATIGIGVGVGIAGLALIGSCVFFWLRRKSRRHEAQPPIAQPHATPLQWGRCEMEGEGHGHENGFSKYRYMHKGSGFATRGINGGELYGSPGEGYAVPPSTRHELP
ncbi:hypothetical protein CC79DRAFT_1358949 [Sarocladium strictum]